MTVTSGNSLSHFNGSAIGEVHERIVSFEWSQLHAVAAMLPTYKGIGTPVLSQGPKEDVICP